MKTSKLIVIVSIMYDKLIDKEYPAQVFVE